MRILLLSLLSLVVLFAACNGGTSSDFTLSLSGDTLELEPFDIDSSTDVTVTPLDGFNGDVTLSASVSPDESGIMVSFETNPITAGSGSSALTINVGSAVADGDYTITVEGTDGTLTRSDTLTLTVAAPDSGGITATYEVQGSGSASPLETQTVTVQGVVTGDFQDGDADDTRNLRGFYIQDETGDADPATSDGVFVFDGETPAVDVNVGDRVRVTGEVAEFFGLTEITSLTDVTVLASGVTLPASVTVSLPSADVVANDDGEFIPDLERFEGMLVSFSDTLTVTEMFNLDRFGELRVSQGGRLTQFTQTNAPDITGYQSHLENIATRTITIDDGQSLQNPDPILYPDGSLDTADAFRMGDTVTDLTGIVHFSRGSGGSGDQDYRIMPTVAPTFVSGNPRTATPDDVGGSLKVASFNVLNYFTTLDSRGADSTTEFERQEAKLVEAITAIDADILGLIELENNYTSGSSSAIATLVAALNNDVGAGTYAYVDPGQNVGGDAIAVGFIYKPATVSIASGTTPAILTDSNLPNGYSGPIFTGNSTNRAPLAVTFVENSSGGVLTIAVNHFKSKGGTGTGGDADAGDGQGNYNATRTTGAAALRDWLATNPTGTSDDDILIIGDLNAYAQEDPITELTGSGYTDQLTATFGADAYGYVFDGQKGTLDYALTNGTLTSQVSGVTEWNINADEADAIDYNLNFGRNAAIFDGTVPYRASDHDPVLIGLNLTGGTPPTPDYTLSLSSDVLGLEPSSSDSSIGATVTPSGGFNDDVTLSASVSPTEAGITVSFGTNPITAGSGSSVLTISVGSAVADGDYDITIEGTGGGLTRSDTLTLTVSTPGGGGGAATGDLVITGVIDGPLSGGVPKAVELYVINNIADLSVYGLGSANNGGGTDGEEFTFPGVAVTAGSYIYVASEQPGFNEFFGFDPDYTSSAMGINGDDAIELFQNGSVVDIFGDINVDGNGQDWEYLDGWAYRADGTGQDGSTFVLGNWTFSGPDALDGETSNGTATTPFPIGTYQP
ncbi:MAG: ExeM/NucH family extracellular endonuclease [Trueperaceae bacterium]|nr:ExeM/NucH family extracellular endonuclease [Trueperaceae bacterium]